MSKDPKKTFISNILSKKKGAEEYLQGVGRKIRKNVDQGQKDFQSGKNKYYGSVNPLKDVF